MNHSCTERGSEKGWFRSVLIAGSLVLGLASGGWATVVAPAPGFDGATAAALRPSYESYITARNGVAAGDSRVAHLSAFTLASHAAAAIPAFARKYNLACSACHTAWPELNAFGLAFKDRGYQLGNDRDSPIWVNPSYWPVAVRTTPGWHLEETTDQPVDDGAGGTVEKTITQAGFDISGADLLFLGTLYKDISFGFVPTFEDGEGVGIEAAFVRFDNLFKSSWANLKIGKFELDNMLSEKRIITLSNNGSFYQSYHFLPVGDGTTFGLGDNQIGVEWLGHSSTSYSRASVAILSGVDGVPGLPEGKGYDGSVTLSQAFDVGKLGIQRIGVFGYLGHAAHDFRDHGRRRDPVPGTGTDNKSFYRVGATGDFFLGNLELLPLYMHGSDDQVLAGGTQDPSWNGYLLELHYYVNPQLMFVQRSELVRMSQQADPATPSDLGNIDAFTFGYRWYPIMFSRAGLAFLGELSISKTTGTVPLSGDGVGIPPLSTNTVVRSTSVLFALDFDF